MSSPCQLEKAAFRVAYENGHFNEKMNRDKRYQIILDNLPIRDCPQNADSLLKIKECIESNRNAPAKCQKIIESFILMHCPRDQAYHQLKEHLKKQ